MSKCSDSYTLDERSAHPGSLPDKPYPVPPLTSDASNNGSNNSASSKKSQKVEEGGKKKKKKKQSKNDPRQKKGQTATYEQQPYMLKGGDELPDIIYESRKAKARDFANNTHTSETLWPLFVDGSSDTGPPSVSPSSQDSSTFNFGLPPPENTRFNSRASVAYEDKDANGGWVVRCFNLPGIKTSGEAELHAINKALQIVLREIGDDKAYKKTVIIFTDSKQGLEAIKKELMAEARSPSKGAQEVAFKAIKLRKMKVPLELRWVPAHKTVRGNVVADQYAKDARIIMKPSSVGDCEEGFDVGWT